MNNVTEAPKILVIVPAFNEEKNLPALLDRLLKLNRTVVVVNDCSGDSTVDCARAMGVPVLDLPANLGIGGAVQTGFKYAVANNFDIAVQIDGDGQHDPAWIDTVILPLIQGKVDCAIGSRYVPDAPDRDYRTPLARRIGMRFSTAILEFATGLRIHDTTSGFRALNRPAFEFFSQSYPVDHPEAEALLVLHRKGFRIQEVPIKMLGRMHGSSLFNLTRSALYPLRVIVGFVGIIFAGKTK
jgi:glycosyltransferase involved in cell wall biosynthesis